MAKMLKRLVFLRIQYYIEAQLEPASFFYPRKRERGARKGGARTITGLSSCGRAEMGPGGQRVSLNPTSVVEFNATLEKSDTVRGSFRTITNAKHDADLRESGCNILFSRPL